MNAKEIFNIGALTGANELPIAVSNSDTNELELVTSFQIGYLNEETLEFFSLKEKTQYVLDHLDEGYCIEELEAEFKKVSYLSPAIDNSINW
jgi:hypothetical protein